MFNSQFYPTPSAVITKMLSGIHLEGCNVLEPSAGKGDIVKALQLAGANVNACEIDTQLQKLIPCKIIADDFLSVTSDQISHVHYIVMNPPFNADEKHILHAYEIAPAGCDIIALCNLSTIKNTYTKQREELRSIVDMYGSFEDLGKAFKESGFNYEMQYCYIVDSIDKDGKDFIFAVANFLKARGLTSSPKLTTMLETYPS